MVEETGPSRVDWNDELEFQNRLRRRGIGEEQLPVDPARLAAIGFERVLIAAAMPERHDVVSEAVHEGAAFGAAAVLAGALAQGRVLLEWPDGTRRHCEAGSRPFGPNNWLHSVSCALAARDAAALNILCEPAHIASSQLPDHLADAFWPFLCTAVAAVVRQPDATGDWIDQAEELLDDDRVSVGDADVIRTRIRPLVALVRALATADGDVNGALKEAASAHRRYFADQGRPGDPNRLLPIDILGLAALAHDRGRQVEPRDLPAWLVRGEFERRPVKVTLEYPPRRLERDEDAVALLDLEGFPRAGREHVIVQRGDDLIARYRMRNGPGAPDAAIDLALPAPDGTGTSASWPIALDACERVLLADGYAHRAERALSSGDAVAARGWLADAIDQIDLVIASIPSEAERVPDAACVSARGKAIREKEPGRLQRDRLTAYRDALAAAMHRQNGPVRSAPVAAAGDAQFRENALLAAAVVGETARPLLLALRRDIDGAVRARLRPHPDDYGKVFVASAVERARLWFEPLWAAGLEMDPPSGAQTELRIHVAPAGMLAEHNEVSRYFPGAYRGLAALLNPHRAWIAWKYVRPGQTSGLAYDGLVWCDDHWAWFPKPYRAFKGETS